MKILLYDCETSFNTVATFRLKVDGYLPHQNIITEGGLTCAAWKFLGEKTVHGVSVLDDKRRFERNKHDDYHVVKTLHKVLSQADVIVAHNGDQFDWKYVQGRILVHGLQRLPPVQSIDTLKVARKHFGLNSSRLDYLGKVLKVGRKMDTPQGLWLETLAGKPSAIRTMLAYNKEDVRLLERVFEKLRPYIKTPITDRGNCSNCGGTQLKRNGTRRTLAGIYPRYYCRDCGKWAQGKEKVGNTNYERPL